VRWTMVNGGLFWITLCFTN